MDKSAKELRIVYMGTPDFAVAPLRALVEGGYNVVAVVTMPDKPAGRGQKMQRSAVGEYATEQGLLLLQPEKLKSEEFVEQFLTTCYDAENLFVHREQGRVVSMAHLLPFRTAEGKRVNYLYGVATDPEWRGRGFASELILRALRRAESENRAVVLIPSGEDVKPFYEALGFVDRGVSLHFEGEFDFGTGDAERDKAMILDFGNELAAQESLTLKFDD